METKQSQFGGTNKAARSSFKAMARGFAQKCPSCGRGPLYTKFLKVTERCNSCSTELHHHRADDAPPYFTIFIVGHILIPLVLLVEKLYQPDQWVHAALWLPLAVLTSFYFLPRVKGAVVGLQWSKYMHGFDPDGEDSSDWSGG